MEYIKSIINSIEKVFDVSEENISSLTVMLADIETSHLYNKFSAEEQSKKYFCLLYTSPSPRDTR